MIQKILRVVQMLWGVFAYFCVATLITQLVLVGVIWAKGGLTPQKRFRIFAMAQGVDLVEIFSEEQRRNEQEKLEAGDLANNMVNNRTLSRRDEIFRKGLVQVDTVKSRLQTSRVRYKMMQSIFDRRLGERETEAIKASRKLMTQTFEVMQPQMARKQFVLMLHDGTGKGIEDVVGIINAMSAAKRSKVLEEFGDAEYRQDLEGILDFMRMNSVSEKP